MGRKKAKKQGELKFKSKRRKATKKNRNEGIGGYHNTMRATRFVSDGEGGKVKQVMECNFGLTTNVRSVGDVVHASGKIFFVNGEANVEDDRAIRVTIYGPKKDIVHIMFKHAIRAIGFEVDLDSAKISNGKSVSGKRRKRKRVGRRRVR